MNQSLNKFVEWARMSRNTVRKGEMLRQARIRVVGHNNYYVITDNLKPCKNFVYHAKHQLFKWINRKSQRKAYTWPQFEKAITWAITWANWPKPGIRKDLNPYRRAEAHRMINRGAGCGKAACPVPRGAGGQL